MAPFPSETVSLAASAPNDTVVFMQDGDDPWKMDLNTSVTIVFGILGLILQAGQICFGRKQIQKPLLENNVARFPEMARSIPNTPMALRGQTPLLQGTGGSTFGRRPRPCSPLAEAPPCRHARQPDRTLRYYPLPPVTDLVRRRNAPQYHNRGQWGGASGSPGGARHMSQYHSNQDARYPV